MPHGDLGGTASTFIATLKTVLSPEVCGMPTLQMSCRIRMHGLVESDPALLTTAVSLQAPDSPPAEPAMH